MKRDIITDIFPDILHERQRQNRLHPYELALPFMFAVLSEEVGEVAEALQSHLNIPGSKETDKHDLYKELIEVAAVAVRMAEQL